MFLPKTNCKPFFFKDLYSGEESTDFKPTMETTLFATSIPISDSLGTLYILRSETFRRNAKSPFAWNTSFGLTSSGIAMS